MDNAQKAITIGVGLFITIIVIAAVMTITGIGQDLLSSGQSQLSGISGQLQTSLTNQYAGQNMSGTLVRTAIQTYYDDTTMAVYVYNTTTSSFTNSKLSATSISSYNSVVLENANEITFDSTVTRAATSAAVSATQGKEVGLKVQATATQLSTLLSNISPTSQYRSFVLTNATTGRALGLLFVRYQ